MSLARILSSYLVLNAIIATAYVALVLGSRAAARFGRSPSATKELRLHYSVLLGALTIALLQPLLPVKAVLRPAARVWSAPSLEAFPTEYRTSDRGGYLTVADARGSSAFKADRVASALLALTLVICLFGSVRLAVDLQCLLAIRRSSWRVRQVGRVSVYMNDAIAVPFSFWLPGRSEVVIPNALASAPGDYRIALAHELQHHRQRDTRWVYALWFLRVICVPNPFIHLWSRWLSEIQEFACDETLVDRKKVESRRYARCLLEVAESALDRRFAPACATGLALRVEGNLLKRRIRKMISRNEDGNGSTGRWIGIVATALMAATAYASQGLVQDQRVTIEDARRLAAKGPTSEFPLVVNDLVVKQLNRYIGTPEGRDAMKKALERMETYRPLIEAKVKAHGVPGELMAVPIIESGYQNLEPNNKMGWGAGLWMFIASSARVYGLKVDNTVDERLDVEKETDAAFRYLKGDRKKFDDWHLSALSYNMGERRVREAMKKTGSSDAWELVRRGFESDSDYLPKLMAAILILRNPETVE